MIVKSRSLTQKMRGPGDYVAVKVQGNFIKTTILPDFPYLVTKDNARTKYTWNRLETVVCVFVNYLYLRINNTHLIPAFIKALI